MDRGALSGFTIGITADRRWKEQADLFERRAARVEHAPTIRTVRGSDDEALITATEALIEEPPDLVVLSTASGIAGWVDGAARRNRGDDLLRTLRGARVLARGPKAAIAATAVGLPVDWKAPGATMGEVLDHLLAGHGPGEEPLSPNGRPWRVAVQLDGDEHPWLPTRLADAGFDVVAVPVYRWALPTDTGPAARLALAVADATVDAVTFTAAPALANFVAIADAEGRGDAVRAALGSGRVVAVCIGPVCAAQAHALGIEQTVEPSHPRLGAMVDACARAFADRRTSFRVGGHELSMQGRLVRVDDGDAVALTAREREVLEVLADPPGMVRSKASLLATVWGGEHESGEHVVEVTIGRLRRRLGAAGVGLETVVRRGYRLAPD